MRVLVVDDEVELAEQIRRGLTAEGFNVSVAHDGQRGLSVAMAGEYDVIVLDLMLPGLSGYKVVKRMRAGGVQTPVLMLTAKDGEYDQADAFDLGVDDYLTKPFSFVVLIARLRALVRRGGAERPAVYTSGDLTLDPSRRRVTRGTTTIPLTAREYGLLEYLLRHQGKVLTKTEILRGVWDEFYDGDANIVEVYVGYLRKKIDVPFDRQTIETIRGMGYRISED